MTTTNFVSKQFVRYGVWYRVWYGVWYGILRNENVVRFQLHLENETNKNKQRENKWTKRFENETIVLW